MSKALARRPSFIMATPIKRRGGLRRRRAGGGRVRRHHRGAGSVSAGSTVTTLAIGGLAVGFLDGKGYLAKIPTIGGSRAITLGVAGFVAVKYGKNKYLKAAGLAALASAAFDYGRVQASAGKLAGLDDNSMGLDESMGDDLASDLDGADDAPDDGGPRF